MKKILTFAVAVAFSTALTAQSVSTIHAGANMSTFTGKDVEDAKFKFGYQVGFTQTFGDFIQIEPGLFLFNKGGKGEDAYSDPDYPEYSYDITQTIGLTYLQIPVNFKVNLGIGDNMNLVLGAGVYASVGLFGNVKMKGKWGGENVDESAKVKFFGDVKDGEDKVEQAPIDFGASIFAGLQFGRIGVNVGYQPGFMSIERKYEGEERWKMNNSSIFLSLSYSLNDPNR
ncbi:MAG: PorT family protein [Bacteroidales bacterium]|nr:PorT family protein [Bacteroidales bacterium]